MTSVPFKCKINTSNPAAKLGIEIFVDNNSVYRNEHVLESVDFHCDIVEDDAEHELKIVMFGKTEQDTVVDDQNNIVSDAMISVKDITIDDIDINQLFIEQSTYTHNFNGSQPEIEDEFYGDLGCNGAVSIKISTPVYIWLLENL
jgi:hypothetical protein